MFPIDYFWRAAQRYPARTAVVCPEGEISFSELSDRIQHCAAALLALDPVQGSRVGIGAANSVDHLVAILAVLAAGKVWVPVNPRNGDPDLRRIVEFASPSLVVLDADMQKRLVGIASRVVTFELLKNTHGDREGLPMGPRAIQGVDLNSTQAIKFTGGTTGFPKGVQQTLRAWNTNIATQIHELGLTQNDRYLVAAPLTHGTSTYMLPLLGVGGALVFPEDTKAGGLLAAIEAHQATVFFAPPTLILALTEAQTKYRRDVSTLRYLVYGGAPMRPAQIREAQAVFGPVVCTSFGQTEAPQIIAFLPPHEMQGERLGSVGRPTLLTQVAILDKSGQPLPTGEEGEIAVRGDLVMSGYLNAEAETRKTLVNGWLRTGDGGVLDEEGYLYLRDRLRDVIITGGFNVYPSDVEVVLSTHPAIADCSVVGVPDIKWGEAVHAAVQLHSGQSINAEEVMAMVKRELGSVKTPKQIHVFETLPRSPVGKVLKPAIREAIQRLEKV